MKHRKLRIAWSVGWAVACLLLVALWIRSFSRWDEVGGNLFGSHVSSLRSVGGRLTVRDYLESSANEEPINWHSYADLRLGEGSMSASSDTGDIAEEFDRNSLTFGFGITWIGEYHNIDVPHWFPAALFLALAGVPWLPWRFSLRTLLVAMTAAAIGLGWIVYALRN